jgi:hypothetical protein
MSPLFGPKPDDVLARGVPASGSIVGIEVRYSHDDPPQRLDEYAVESGGTTYGVRQQLSPASEVRLGMTVPLRVDGKIAVIDWGDVNTYRWKPLATPPARGITDDSNGLGGARKKWTAATATVLGLTTRPVMLGLGSANDLTVRVAISGQEPYETTIAKAEPAHYATHLVAVGSEIPAWVNPSRLDKVQLDWAAAALANPGVSAPSALPDRAEAPRSMMGTDGSTAVTADEVPDIPIPAFLQKLGMTSSTPDEVEDAVSWDTFIAVFKATGNGAVQGAQAEAIATGLGVPSGEWDAAQARWMKRISRDMKLGMAFGQALNG